MTYLVRVLALLGSPNLNGLLPYRWLWDRRLGLQLWATGTISIRSHVAY